VLHHLRCRSDLLDFWLPGSAQALQVSLLPVRISVGNNEKVTGMRPASQMSRSAPSASRSPQMTGPTGRLRPFRRERPPQ
jgi:hypothetical protein